MPSDSPRDRLRRVSSALPTPVHDGLRVVVVLALVALLLVTVTGLWPPMVVVESPSMEPNLYRTDLVVLSDTDRYEPAAAVAGSGVVTASAGRGTDYRSVGDYGDVVVFRPDGDGGRTPIIHRASFHVEAGENWYSRANASAVPGSDCGSVPNCPAPHAGFVTKGDNNAHYDQVNGNSGVVRSSWVVGRAELRIPWLGWLRLQMS